jgi:hypothetical protein
VLVPSVASDGDGAIALGLTYSGAALGSSPFTVVNTWNTSGENYARLLHMRITIDSARDALLFANFFRVSVPTDDGPEVYFAIDSAGPRVISPGRSAKDEIAPAEDLGLLGHAFVSAQTPATYVLTFVIGDRKADLAKVASTLTYLPQ